MDKRVCMYCGEVLAANAVSCARCVRPPAPPARSPDAEHVRMLAIFHFVLAGMKALFACFPLIHLAIGIFMVAAPQSMRDSHGGPPPAAIGWFFIAFASVFILVGWTLAILTALAGRSLLKHRRYTFCFVIACLECVFMPFGTVLGVFTLVVLSRPGVKALFDRI